MAIQTSTNQYQNSRYIVGSGLPAYATIQAAINAANADGGNAIVYLRPGTYTENLTLYSTVAIEGADNSVSTINGIHTPPTSGVTKFINVTLASDTHILSSNAAGSTSITFSRCGFSLTNGYICNLPNWTGNIQLKYCSGNSVSDGVVNNVTGTSPVSIYNSSIGTGTAAMLINGPTEFFNVKLDCPITIAGAAVSNFEGACCFNATMTIGGTASVTVSNSRFATGAGTALINNSTVPVLLTAVSIDSSNTNAINGSGEIDTSLVSFVDSSGVGTATHTLTGLSALGTGYMTGGIVETFSTAGVVVNDDTGTLNSINDNVNVGYVLTTNATGGPTFQAAGAGGGIGTLDGDSGSATGATVTIAGDGTNISTSGTLHWERLERQGRIFDKTWKHYNGAHIVAHHPTMSDEQLYGQFLKVWNEFFKKNKDRHAVNLAPIVYEGDKVVAGKQLQKKGIKGQAVVTGIGFFSPIGNDQEALLKALKDGKPGITPITKFESTTAWADGSRGRPAPGRPGCRA